MGDGRWLNESVCADTADGLSSDTESMRMYAPIPIADGR